MFKNENTEVIFLGTYNRSEILPGPHKVAKRIFEQYSKINKTVFINYYQDGEKYSLFQKLFGSNLIDEVNGSPVILMGIITLMLFVVRLRPKIIHLLNYERFVIFAILLKLILRFKLFYTVNGVVAHENKYYNTDTRVTIIKNRIVEYLLINSCNKIFVLSDFSKRLLLQYYHINILNLVKVFNGIDDIFLIDSCQNNRQREINSIVFIGNIYRKEKGFRKLIETLIKIDIELKLYIIDKPINNNTIKIYNKLVQLCFVDRLKPKELKYFLSDKHFIVSPSTYDNFNISVMEGIACGLIPMLSKNTGMSELLSTDYVINDFSNASEIKNFIKSHRDICTAKIDLRKYSWQNVLVEYLKHYY